MFVCVFLKAQANSEHSAVALLTSRNRGQLCLGAQAKLNMLGKDKNDASRDTTVSKRHTDTHIGKTVVSQ